MAKSHRSRRASRRSRRSSRSRRVRRGGGLARKVYSPISHLLQATNEAVGTVTNTVKSVAKSGISGVNRIGKSVTGHTDAAVRNVFSRKGRNASRKSRKSRKSRRASRR
jgi:hypothetical protein